jgi:hypothetical protein
MLFIVLVGLAGLLALLALLGIGAKYNLTALSCLLLAIALIVGKVV